MKCVGGYFSIRDLFRSINIYINIALLKAEIEEIDNKGLK